MDSDSARVLTATAASGTLTGTYKIEIVSIATSTQMTSEKSNRDWFGKSFRS